MTLQRSKGGAEFLWDFLSCELGHSGDSPSCLSHGFE